MARDRHFTFLVEGDPAVTPALAEGMAHIKKNLVPMKNQGIDEYQVDGQNYLVRSIDFQTLMRDIGVEAFHAMRLPASKGELLEELPGPIAATIFVTGELCVVPRLSQWYAMDRVGNYTLRVRP